MLVEDIDALARRLGRPILLARFGPKVGRWRGRASEKRAAVLEELTRLGVTFTPSGPPSTSGWLSYLGDVYFDVSYAPGEARYEELRRVFETENGEPLDPEAQLYVFRDDGQVG